MHHRRAEALGGRLLQISEHPIHATGINPRIAFRDLVRALPALLIIDEPSTLLWWE